MRRKIRRLLSTVPLLVLFILTAHDLLAQTPTRVSVDSGGNQGDSEFSQISADGRFVVFRSGASNLVAADTNGADDIFVHERQTGETTRVSVDSRGNQGNSGSSSIPSISADGRFVAFFSTSSNLVARDTNGFADVFVHERQTGETTRVSVDSQGNQGILGGSTFCSISADGRFVAFGSFTTNLVTPDTNTRSDLLVHDRQTRETTRVNVDSQGNQGTLGASLSSISADGRFVAFGSSSSDLVAATTNDARDVFVHDRKTGETTRVSVDSRGNQGNLGGNLPSINADGRFVAFDSTSSNLVAGDTNGERDVFVHDRKTGETTRVSVDSQGNQGNSFSRDPSISTDSRFVVFNSRASNLVAGDTNGEVDIFVHDRQTGETTRVSVDSRGNQGNSFSLGSSISADGRFVAFDSSASNLVAADTNERTDVFVYDRQTKRTTRVSVASQGN